MTAPKPTLRMPVTFSAREWEVMREVDYHTARRAAGLSVTKRCPDRWPLEVERADGGVTISVPLLKSERASLDGPDGLVAGLRRAMLSAAGAEPDATRGRSVSPAKPRAAVPSTCTRLPASDSRRPMGRSHADLVPSRILVGRHFLPNARTERCIALDPLLIERVLAAVPVDTWLDVWAITMRVTNGRHNNNGTTRRALHTLVASGAIESMFGDQPIVGRQRPRLYKRMVPQ